MNWIKSIIKTIIKEQFVLLLCLFVYSSNGFSQSNNPIISLADVTTTCFDDNSDMPKFFLCGSLDTRLITTDFPGLTVSWYKFNEGSCSTITDDCSNSNSPCTWTLVATSPNFTVSAGGHFKVVITNSDTTQTTYYFNVYQNGLDIPVTKTDMYCGQPGEIRVAQLTGYEYSVDGTNYQVSNTFSVSTAGTFNVKVRRVGATPTDCVFNIPVTITNNDMVVAASVIPSATSGQQGDVKLSVSGVREQYYYRILQGGLLISEKNASFDNEHLFPNLNAGTYTWEVRTDDCNWKSGEVTINSTAPFQITPTVQPVACQPGSIKVVVTGGTAPYQYFFNGNTTPTSDLIPVPIAGTYIVKVVDTNGLTNQISVTVPSQPAPVYKIEATNENCYFPNSWQIKFNVTNANGYSLRYRIRDDQDFTTNPVFQGLLATPAGTTFKTVIEYTYGGVKCTETKEVTITQPQFGLSAVAGVSELIGCISTDLDKARIRITNPQGGTEPYEYSFDNRASWTTSTTSLHPAGKYVFYIKDKNGCVSALPEVTVEDIGVPIVTVTNQSFNCDGTANSVINATTTTNTVFSYRYSLDGGAFQTSPNFSNLPPGQHTVEVKYEPLLVPTYSNLLKEDFGYGADTTSPGMNATYCFERQVTATRCKGSIVIQDGDYSVTSRIVSPYGAWYSPKDNTPPTSPVTPLGRFLAVNVDANLNPRAILYEKTIADIIPNQPIIVEFYVTNLLRTTYNATPPNITIALVDQLGNEISTINTGNVPRNELWNKYPVTPVSLNPGNNSSLRFIVRNNNPNGGGNDLAIDDITAYQIPKLCASSRKVIFNVPTGKDFAASITNTKNVTCHGLSNGEITIAAQNFNTTSGYQVSKDGGVTWQTATTSPFIISGLGGATYDVKVRYNPTATGICVKSFPSITITAPSPIVTSASVTIQASCSRGATITATSTGGTPFYQYELWDELNINKIRPAQSGVFENVPVGTYTVRGLDANGCGNTSLVPVIVVPPPIPVPTVDFSSDLCYDSVNQATIKINVASGTAPFSFSLNGGALQNSNTFTNVAPGTHKVEVTDANNCKATTQDITIGNELKVAAVLTKALDCTASPDAKIKVTFEGGVRPLRYQVKKGTATISSDITIPVGDSSFVYSISETDPGTYSFSIIDANGCSKTTNAVIVNSKVNPEILSFTEIQSILCHAENTAAIQVNLNKAKGLAPFTYSVKNTTTNTNYGSQLFSLPAGNYEVTVTDSNLCTAKLNTIISEPAKIIVTSHTVDITCTSLGISKGSVIVDGVVGGIPSYNYFVTGVNGYNNFEINNSGSTSHTFDVVDFGLYQINVVDSNGCSVLIQDVKVASPPTDLDINVSTSTINCSLGGRAIVGIADNTAFSSAGPFYFAIYTPGLVFNLLNPAWIKGDTAKSATFTGLISGVKYTFIVYDETTKCYHYKTAETAIKTNSTLVLSNLQVKNITCKGEANGKVSFKVTNNYTVAMPIFYQIYNSQSAVPVSGVSGTISINPNNSITISDLGDLPFGNYFVLIKEDTGAPNAGCSIASDTFNITESALSLEFTASVLKKVNCNENGIISIRAKGGTAPYQYQIVTDSSSIGPGTGISLVPPPPSLIPGNWVNHNTFSVDEGNYIVSVRDAYGCVKSMTIYLPKDPKPVIDLSVTNPCEPEGTFTINLTTTTAGIAPYYLTVNGSVFAPITSAFPHTLSNQNSGDYSISVKDVNGCSDTKLLKIYSPLGLSSRVIKQPSCSLNNGEIQAIPVGGSGSFEYKIDTGSYGTSPIFSGLSSGPHTIYIKDNSTLCEKSILVNLEVPTAVTGLTLTPKSVSCHGGSDGSITVAIATPAPGINDNPVYTYSLNGGTPQTSNIFSGLAAGSYTVEVISGRGCVATDSIFVSEPIVIVVPTPTVTEFGCNSTNNLNNASITVSGVSGGSGTYTQYEFIKNGTRVQFGSSPIYIETDLNGGSYTINVYDDKGCSGTTTAIIDPLYVLDTINVFVTNEISCSLLSETIQVSVTPTTIPSSDLEYSLIPVSGSLVGTPFSSNPTGIFPGLTVGEYLITARNTVTNCTIQEVYTVNEPNTFDITIDSVVDVSCFGGANGSANITLIDRNTPSKAGAFDYTIKDSSGITIQSSTSTNASPIPISGLKADVYSITATLTNTPFCSVTKNFTISQPTAALDLNTTLSAITCAIGNNDGKITALPMGGWSDFYEFKWEKAGTVIEDWGDVSELSNLTQSTYKVYVRDAQGCEVEKLVMLTNPNPIALTAAADKTQLQCFGDQNASILVSTVSGGQGSNYWYTLNKTSPNPLILGPQTDTEFKNLGAGIYTVTVTDNWSCTATSAQIIINEPNNVVATLSLLTPPTCMNPAQLDLQITGGTPPFSYSSNNLDFIPTLSNPLNGNPGVNRYYIKDTNGCGSYISNDVVVATPVGLSVAVDTTFAKVNCFGESTATILASAQGGLGNYFYTLLDEGNSIIRTAQPTGIFAGLPAGKYKVKVTSADCNPVESSIITITEPAAKLNPSFSLKNALCAGSNDGSVKITSLGGTVTIKHAISPNLSQFTESDLFQNLAPGDYDLLVQDALGCYEKTTLRITEPPVLSAVTIPSSIVQEICFDDKNAQFSIVASGGTLPYSVSVDNPSGPFTTGTAIQTQFNFTNLTGGNHTVYIKDANNCILNWTVALDNAVKLNPTISVNYDCVSNAQNNLVTVQLDSSIANTALVQFALDGGVYQASNTFSNLSPGDHFIRVKHINGCVKDTPVLTILKMDPLVLSLKSGGLNEIIAVPSGGGGNYTFTFEGENYGSTPNYIYYTTQDYLVTVKDANGCISSATQKFNYIDICTPNYFTPNGDGINDTWAPGCTINYKNLTYTILDRYGRELGSYRLGQTWDGKYQGAELPSGDYWYVLKLNDPKDDREFVGHFTLYR
ncbi:T9SS type B sorting domain-containing protein [Flavobacterium ammonificans]|uniref:T9SS type B sorting domain-containing protein n=1 Tax=Flavobacterium ammonificans TaxID=1751056 RepID=UPI001E638F45|nr:T9SS type B sorting domain-containing protein [Flavobacterium ammonificans]BDB56210.1 T9SS C-terminal target domain-containing protein [Flavobacterium ammonificans]